jgi:excisionase family DNA binding protein
VHHSTVRKWLRNGELKGHRAGRHHRILRTELEKFMAGDFDDEMDEEALHARAVALAAMP